MACEIYEQSRPCVRWIAVGEDDAVAACHRCRCLDDCDGEQACERGPNVSQEHLDQLLAAGE